MASTDQYERYYAQKLWAMIPEIYRYEDSLGKDAHVLEQLIEVIAEDAARSRRSIDRLWEDQHVDSADDWAIPYLGDLVGTRMLPEVDTRGRRVDVARTVFFRRRKGTPTVLETIAREVSGWDVILVEAFRRLARSAHRLDRFPVETGRVTRTPRAGTAQLKSPRTSDLSGTGFDEMYRTPDPRPLRGVRGRFNLAKVNFHLFQQLPYSFGPVTPARLMDAGPVTFTLDPSGRDVPIFQRGQVVSSESTCGAPWSSAALGDVPQVNAECDPRCRATEEWHVAKAMTCRHYDHVAFVVQELHVALLDDGTATPSDLRSIAALVGFRIEGEPRLRFLLERQGVSLDPEPSFYRRLLELAVTSDSGRKVLAASVVFGRDPGSGVVPLTFYESVGANLASRLSHPVPSDPAVLLLLHPELGRFAEPQPQLLLDAVEGPACRAEPEADPNPGGGDGTDSDSDSSDADGDGGDGTGPGGDGAIDSDGDSSDGDGGAGDGDSGTGTGDGGGDSDGSDGGEGDSDGSDGGEGDSDGSDGGEGDSDGSDGGGEGDSSDGDGGVGDGDSGTGTGDGGGEGDSSDGDGGVGDGDSGTGTGDGGGDSDGSDGGDGGEAPVAAGVLFFAAGGPLLMADRVFAHDTAGTGFSTIVCGDGSGDHRVDLGVDSRAGNVWGSGNVNFRNRARVVGFVKTEGNITSQDPVPDIGDLANTEQGASLDFSELAARLDFTVAFSGGPDHTIGPFPNRDVTLAPGNYGAVTVTSGGILRVSAGIYKFNRLDLDSSASLSVDGSGGKVYLFVQNQFTHRALTLLSNMTAADLFFVVMSATVNLDSPHAHYGIVIVPNGALTLSQVRPLSGTFYAQSIATNPDQRCFLQPWDGTLPGVTYGGGSSLRSASPLRGARVATTGVLRSAVEVGTGQYDVSFELPVGVEMDDVVLYADGGPLQSGGNVVRGPGGPGTVVCMHTSPLTVGAGSQVGDVWAAGPLEILAGAVVEGDVHGTTTVNNAGTVTGSISTAGFSTTLASSFSVVFSTGAPDQAIAGDEPVELAPGDYGDVEVTSGGRLVLRGGDYRFDSLVLASGTELQLDLTSAIRLSVRTSLDFQGTQRVLWGSPALFELRYFGTSLLLGQPFSGRLLAPLASLVLGNLVRGQHQGSFFASQIDVTGSTRILALTAGTSVVPLNYAIGQAGPVGALGVPIELAETPQHAAGGGIVALGAGMRAITFDDSHTYRMEVVAGAPASDHVLLLQGAEATRPYLLLSGALGEVGHFSRAASDPSRLEIAGVWLGSFYDGRQELIVGPALGTLPSGDYDWDEVVIRQSTVDPGGVRADGSVLAPIRIVVRAQVRRLVVDRSILGPLIVDSEAGGAVEDICIVDSIIDASREPLDGDGRQVAIRNTSGTLRLAGVTVLGDIVAEHLEAGDSIVTGGLVVADTQRSCFRFGATSAAALPSEAGEVRAPKFFQAFTPERILPHHFVSRRFGDPGYAQLAPSAPLEMQTGAENGSEMGAYSFTLRPIRLASVRAKVTEFQPVGIMPQFILERASPDDTHSAAE